jgi:uncharacterized protein (TIGR02217 family)
MSSRLTQQVLEVVTTTSPTARLTHQVLEVLSTTIVPTARLTHQVLEVLRAQDRTPLPCEPLPGWIAFGASGGPDFGVSLFTSPGGWEERIKHWPQVRGRWDVSFVNCSAAQIAELVAFMRAVAHGQADNFCFKDVITPDYQFDNQIGIGTGATQTFQLVKVYQSGSLTATRPLTRPIPGTLTVTLNGVPTEDFEVNLASGEVIFDVPPASGALVWAAGEFETLVRFASDRLDLTCVAPGVFSAANLSLLELLGE